MAIEDVIPETSRASFIAGGEPVDFSQYSVYARYFAEIVARYQRPVGLAGLGPEGPKSLQRLYVSQTLSQIRTTAEVNQELALVAALKMPGDKKLTMEIERFVKRQRSVVADAAVPHYPFLLVTGQPGSGKTTLLSHLAFTCCQKSFAEQSRGTVPVILPLNLLGNAENKSLVETLGVVLAPFFLNCAGENNPLELARLVLGAGPCLLMLDGFEYLCTKTLQKRVATEILELSQLFPGCRVLITATHDSCQNLLPGFQVMGLNGFDEKKAFKYLRKWFTGATAPQVPQLSRELNQNPMFRHLTENPLMLTLLAIIFQTDGSLPTRRNPLYQRLAQLLRQYRQNLYPQVADTSPGLRENLLKKLAFHSYSQQKNLITVAHIQSVVTSQASEFGAVENAAQAFINTICLEDELIRPLDEGSFEFINPWWWQYYVALELWQRGQDLEVITDYVTDPDWEEPVLFYAGMMEDATPLIQYIVAGVDEENYYSSYILAGKCLAEARLVQPPWSETITAELWSLYQDDVLIEAIGSPVEVLAGIKSASLIEELIGQLTASQAKVRAHAAYVLESLGDTRAVAPLIRVLGKDRDAYSRGVAAATLGAIGAFSEVFPALIAALKKEKNSYVRAGVIEAFRMLGSDEAVSLLLGVLKNDSNDYVRSGAADALANLGVVEVIPQLAELLALDPSIDVRMSAADALGQLGNIAALPALTNALLRDEEWQVRVRAVEALEELNSIQAVPNLIYALAHDKDWQVRINIVALMCMLGCEAAVPSLLNVIQTDPHGFVRYRAVKALGKIGDRSALPVLKKAMTTRGTGVDGFIKKMAQQAIEKINQKPA